MPRPDLERYDHGLEPMLFAGLLAGDSLSSSFTLYLRLTSKRHRPLNTTDKEGVTDMPHDDRQVLETAEVQVGSEIWQVKTAGSVDAPLLLLLGHVPDVSWSLDQLQLCLSESFRVLQPERLDLPDGEALTFRQMASSVAALIETVTTSRVTVAGVAFGGTVAAYLASTRRDLVRAICTINTEHPDVYRVDNELARQMSDAYAYVADFLDPDFKQRTAGDDYGLLTQFWQQDPWWPEHRERYLEEIQSDAFLERVAQTYRANFRWAEAEGTFTEEDAERVSAFGRRCAAVRAGEPRRLVAPVEDPEPCLIEVPALMLFSAAGAGEAWGERAHGHAALSRFVAHPRIVHWPDRGVGVHHSHAQELGQLIGEFHDDVESHHALAREAAPDLARDRRDSRHLVDNYDTKIREFRCPAIGKAECAMRGSHPKTHGVVHSTFRVVPDLAPELRLGLFAEPGTEYECMMRFSSLGKPILEVFHDRDRDVRGVGIKVLKPGTQNTLNDFLLNTVPILSTRNGRDVVPQNLDFMKLEHLLDYADELVVPHVLEVSYYSQTPYRYGPRRAVKYRVRPQPLPEELADDGVDLDDPVFLRRRLEHAMSHAQDDVVFDFMVQFQTDPEHDPIEDPRVEWRGEYLKVAEIRIPPQQVNAPENDTRDEAISFHLYHCLAEHAPLGAVNRSRRAVYYSSPSLRHELNEFPGGLYPWQPEQPEVCVIGSGVAGMSAAMALAENGHRVTVVEKLAEIGGHACSIDIGDGHSGDPAFGSFTGGAYPNVQRLMHKLGVEYEEHGAFKDALSYYSFDRKQYWKQIEDIPHSRHIFDEVARFDPWAILEDESYDYVTAREYFEAQGFSEEFIHQYFLGSVIFVFVGHPANYYLDYPIRQLVKYSYMPVVLDSREPVCRVKLGSGYYMKRFREVLEGHGVRFLTSTETKVLERRPSGVELSFRSLSGQQKRWQESFQHLVLAIQPPGALQVLGDTAEAEEQEILSSFKITHDTAVVHRDTKCMPEHRHEWRHGNKAVPDLDEEVDRERPFIFTKWAMCNNDRKTDVFSTYAYNRDLGIDGGKRATFDHVKVTPEVVRLRKRIENRQGLGSVWYCGSWMRAFTLHEDGLVTGLKAANGILAGMKEYPIYKKYELTQAKKRIPWGETHTFPDVLAYQAQVRGHKMALTYVDDKGDEVASMTFGELYAEARKLAGHLRSSFGVEAGDRVLLIYLPGIDFVVGFVGTILAGAVPVPAYPPNPRNLSADLRKITAVVESSGARIALTTKEYRRMSRIGSVLSPTAMLKWPRQLKWRTVDDLGEPPVAAPRVEAKREDLAFLQYTSGSTADPKGVMITHGNMMHQLAIASEALGFSPETVGVCWVPQYHDLGLVGSILNALYSGASYVFTSPVSFLKRPALWGEMLHRYKATATAAPDFGYRLLLRKTTPEQRQSWDWGSLEIAMSAGEAVDYETMNGFNDAFACTGIHPQVFSPAYGLAEHVVAVSMGGERLFHIDKSELQLRNQIRFGSHRVVGCGKPPESVAVAIVDPETRQRTSSDEVGEIWVSSPSKAAGYWRRPELTREIFEAKLDGDDLEPQDAERTWLRTGDLGFMHHGEVFVTGRSKDLIILRGRNVYPVDLEKAAERASKELRPGCSAVFGIGAAAGDGHSGNGHSGNGHSGNGHDDEALAICVEVRNKGLSKSKKAALIPKIRKEIMNSEGIHVGTVALLEPRTIPKTTSGKVKRRECQRQWFDGALKTVHVDEQSVVKSAVVTGPQVAVQSSVEAVLHAAVFEVTRLDVEHETPLADQVDLDSVEFLELVGIITQRLKVDLPITALTQYPSISALAGYIRGLPDVSLPDPRIVTLNPENGAEAQSLFLVHPARGGIECFLELAKQWHNPLFAFRQVEPAPTLEALAESYIAALKSVRPEGPYLLGGYSFGATVSREMARLLEARGESVTGLVLIDEIHRSPSEILDCPQGEEIGMFLSVCAEYLPAAELDRIRASLAAGNGSEVSLDEALQLVADPDIQTTIAEQLETYSRNVRLLDGYEPAEDVAPRTVLVRSEESFNRILDSFDRVITVPGGHSSMLYPPHVAPLSRGVQEAVEYCAPSRN